MCHCFLKNVIDQTMEETALKRRLVVDLARPLKPKLTIFPSRKPISQKSINFGSKVLKGSSWAVTKARAAVGAKTFWLLNGTTLRMLNMRMNPCKARPSRRD